MMTRVFSPTAFGLKPTKFLGPVRSGAVAGARGFTTLELLVVLASIAILALLIVAMRAS